MIGNLLRSAAVAVAGVWLAGCADDAPEPQQTGNQPADVSDEIERVADAYLAAVAEARPEIAYFGYSDIIEPDHAALSDNSPEAKAAFEAVEDDLLADLDSIDADGLRADDPAAWVAYVSLRETLEASRALRVCRSELWSLNHLSGWQTMYPRVAAMQPVETETQRADALERWAQLPDFIRTDRAWLERGLEAGYSAPRPIVRRVIAQLDAMLAAPEGEPPFAAFAAEADDHPDFQAEVHALMRDEIRPALEAYRDFLETEYLPEARESLAVTDLPDGEACYEASLRGYTSLPTTAQETFARGSAAVAANREGVVARGRELYGLDDFDAIIAANKAAPGNSFVTEEAYIAYARAAVERAREQVAPLFADMPAQEVVVEPYPEYLRGSGQSSRYERSGDPDRPSTFRIATDDWADETRGGAEILAVHETWPGHHLQIAVASDLPGLHPAVRLARTTAYVEGWARYSEALAEEAGVYRDGYAEITRRAWPARGMVVDPGVHALGWTRAEALAFLRESGRFDGQSGEDMVDRIAVWPGQLTAYDTGALEIMALRREAEATLGADFDIAAFHQRILENGALPLPALREVVRDWIAAEAGGDE